MVWHDVECGSYDGRPAAVARARRRRAGPRARPRRRDRPRGARPRARAGTRSTPLDLDPVLLAALRERAAGPAGARPTPATRASFDLGAPRSPSCLAPMQTVQLLGGPAGRAGDARRRAPPPAPGRPGRRCAVADVVEGFDEDDGGRARARHARGRRRRLREPPDGDPPRGRRVRPAPPAREGHRRRRPRRHRATAPGWTACRPRSSRREARAAGFAVLERRTVDRDRRPRRQRRWWCSVAELRVCALYPDVMNIYADRGNLLLLERRCAWRGIGFTVTAAGFGEPIDPDAHDLFYLGGGQDRDQRLCAFDLVETKRDALHAAAARGALVLGVCGGLQLLGHAYEMDGEEIPGLGLVDLRTVREEGPRLIGNVAIEVDLGGTAAGPRVLAGFENHGGRTLLGPGEQPLGRVLRGHGNDGRSGGEGVRRGSVIGTYLHGPLLPKNAWFADWLIAQATGRRRPRAARRRARGRRAPERPRRRGRLGPGPRVRSRDPVRSPQPPRGARRRVAARPHRACGSGDRLRGPGPRGRRTGRPVRRRHRGDRPPRRHLHGEALRHAGGDRGPRPAAHAARVRRLPPRAAVPRAVPRRAGARHARRP